MICLCTWFPKIHQEARVTGFREPTSDWDIHSHGLCYECKDEMDRQLREWNPQPIQGTWERGNGWKSLLKAS
jgi:hypothetical protein